MAAASVGRATLAAHNTIVSLSGLTHLVPARL